GTRQRPDLRALVRLPAGAAVHGALRGFLRGASGGDLRGRGPGLLGRVALRAPLCRRRLPPLAARGRRRHRRAHYPHRHRDERPAPPDAPPAARRRGRGGGRPHLRGAVHPRGRSRVRLSRVRGPGVQPQEPAVHAGGGGGDHPPRLERGPYRIRGTPLEPARPPVRAAPRTEDTDLPRRIHGARPRPRCASRRRLPRLQRPGPPRGDARRPEGEDRGKGPRRLVHPLLRLHHRLRPRERREGLGSRRARPRLPGEPLRRVGRRPRGTDPASPAPRGPRSGQILRRDPGGRSRKARLPPRGGPLRPPLLLGTPPRHHPRRGARQHAALRRGGSPEGPRERGGEGRL
ncbi:MAG: hypothetical protein AVDCRST_MAG25-1935, partial [uncultured Rubrobacteraceae bacterium]